MILDRDIRVTILGNTGVGKTSLIKRLTGDPIVTEKTLDITVETRKIRLLSQDKQGILSLERYRKYNIVCVDSPGDFRLRRKWREVMREYKTDGIMFMLDISQPVEVQKVAMEDAYNYYLDSLSIKPEKAKKIADKKRAFFYFVVNKMDLVDFDEQKGKEFLKQFDPVIEEFRMTFPFSLYAEKYISVTKSSHQVINSIFEDIKGFLYDNKKK